MHQIANELAQDRQCKVDIKANPQEGLLSLFVIKKSDFRIYRFKCRKIEYRLFFRIFLL